MSRHLGAAFFILSGIIFDDEIVFLGLQLGSYKL